MDRYQIRDRMQPMPAPPRTGDAVLELIRKSELADDDVLTNFLQQSGPIPPTADDTATRLVQAGVLTPFQAQLILQGKYKGFRLGPYKILSRLGSGGMAQVYLAEHVRLHRKVALKVLTPKYAQDPAIVEQFYREGRAAAAVDHSNIVRAYDIDCANNTHFLVLEYIEGQTLNDRRLAAGGRLSVAEACGYAVQIAAGLQHAHELGLAHRDINPNNVLVDTSGVVKILDLGLAHFFQSGPPALSGRSDPGRVMGTTDYVSPEQLIDCASADHRTDIYSLGATLYHLLTGQPPFSGTTTAKIIAHHLQPVPTAHEVQPDVPEAVSQVIARMMAKTPAERYQSAAEVMEALLPFASEGVAGQFAAQLHRTRSRRRWWLGLAGAIGLAAGVVAVWLLRR
jgi:serine/threonine-protein kinase